MEDVELKRYQDRIELGVKANELLGTDIGSAISKSMGRDVADALDDFLAADPTDAKRITEIQVRIKVAIAIPEWLEKVISDASAAHTEYLSRKQMEQDLEKQR